MNAKLISFAMGAALLASSSAFAGQSFGRDSVYAAPGSGSRTLAKAMTATTRPGRASVYAHDVPVPTSKGDLKITQSFRPGRT